MGALEIIFYFYFYFFLLFFSKMITSTDDQDNYCSSYHDQCSPYSEPLILSPFRLKGHDRQPDRCNKGPGFDLTCNGTKTVLELPFSGEFFVSYIYYITNEIGLYDPDDCLAKRILNLNLSGSPFTGSWYQNQTFFNCSSSSVNLIDISSSLSLKPVGCLSSSSHTVLVTNNFTSRDGIALFLLNASCELIGTVPVPVPMSWAVFGHRGDGVIDVLVLTWVEPSTTAVLISAAPPSPPPPQSPSLPNGLNSIGQWDVVYLCLGIPALVSFIWCCNAAFQGCGRGSDDANPNSRSHELSTVAASLPPPSSPSVPPQSPVNVLITSGLTDATIQSYPKMIFSEACRQFKSHNTTCSICLSDYRSKETLRSIPVCNHCFHAKCIDGWLRMNATCPVCRRCLIVHSVQPPSAHPT